MIDWIKAIIPCDHTQEISGGVVMSLDPQTGEIEWQTRKRRQVEGSHSSRVQVKTHDIGFLLVDGNPAKFLQGHNIFGSDDPVGLCRAFFERVCTSIGVAPTEANRQAWQAGDFELKRVDVTESFRLNSQQDVSAWLRAATAVARGKHQAVSAYDGDTLYLGQNSRRISLKVYNKWRELQKHRLPESIPNRESLEKAAEPLLRAEVRVLAMELKRRGLDRGSDWTRSGIGRELVFERIGMLKMSAKVRLTEEEIETLPGRLIGAYKLWKQGEDLRAVYSRPTFYRYRGELLKNGIDITTPQPTKPQVVPLIRYLTAEHVSDPPEWAKGTSLYFEPKDAVAAISQPRHLRLVSTKD